MLRSGSAGVAVAVLVVNHVEINTRSVHVRTGRARRGPRVIYATIATVTRRARARRFAMTTNGGSRGCNEKIKRAPLNTRKRFTEILFVSRYSKERDNFFFLLKGPKNSTRQRVTSTTHIY